MADEYESNYDNSREDHGSEMTESVNTGSVIVRQKSGFGKFVDNVIVEDIRDIGAFLYKEVVVKSFVDFVWNFSTNALSMMLYGRSSNNTRGSGATVSRFSYGGYTNYNNCSGYSNPRYAPDPPQDRNSVTALSVYDYENIIFPDRGMAEAVITIIEDIFEIYKEVSVPEFYEAVSEVDKNFKETPPYTANRYGWTTLNGVKVLPRNGGYYIKMPRAVEIKEGRR